MSPGWGSRLAHRNVAALGGLLCLLAACDAGAMEFRRVVVGNGATPPGGMLGAAQVMQATAGQAIVGQSGDGSLTQVHGFWARGGVVVLGVDGPPKGTGLQRLAFGPPFPNPAISDVHFTITIPQPGHVRLDVFDLQGREVEGVIDGPLAAGVHSVRWAASVAPGVYLARLSVGGARVAERRLIVLH
jgi:hypothetical protein